MRSIVISLVAACLLATSTPSAAQDPTRGGFLETRPAPANC